MNDEMVHCSAYYNSFKVPKNARKYCIDSHESSSKHVTSFRRWEETNLRQLPTREQLTEVGNNPFYEDITKMMIYTNIPLSKVNNPNLREFLEKWCGKKCPDTSTIRKNYMSPIYDRLMEEIRQYLKNHWIYIQVDEAHASNRRIFSMIVGRLNGENSKSYLLNVAETDSAANNHSVVRFVNDSLLLIWPDSMQYDNVRLILTDQASHMLKAARLLRDSLYPHLHHVSCMSHCLSRVCEKARIMYPNRDKLITNLKMLLNKCIRRRDLLVQLTQTALPSLPVPTRWGTWIEFANYVFKNLDGIRGFAERVKDEDSSSIFFLIQCLEEESIEQDLAAICDLDVLPATIRKLGGRNLSIIRQKQLLDEVYFKLPERLQARLQPKCRIHLQRIHRLKNCLD